MFNSNNKFKFTAISMLVATVSACGGSSSNKPGTDTYQMKELESSDPHGKLAQASSSEQTLNRIRNGLLLSSNQSFFNKDFTGDTGIQRPTALVESFADSTASPTPGFSQTNLIEAGVDEADLVKFDGKTLFIGVNQYSPLYEPFVETPEAEAASTFIIEPITDNESYIRALQELEDGSMELVAEFAQHKGGNLDGLYLANDELISIVNQDVFSIATDLEDEEANVFTPSFTINKYDVTDPANATVTDEVVIAGHLVRSRRIDDKLYVLSQFYPTIPLDYIYEPQTDVEYRNNETLVGQLPLSSLLPTVEINQTNAQSLVDGANCFLPAGEDDSVGYASTLTVTVFDLNDLSNFESNCLNIDVHGFYMSQSSIYLTNHNWTNQQTTIHKLALTDTGVDYQATGQVDGYLGWRGEAFRMNEHEGHLRVLTTTNTEDETDRMDHHLYVFETNEQTNTLDLVSQLPNENQPKEIGKVNEDVYAVRFYGDRAYIVTFEQIDPLYSVDLSDPENPILAGELEVPGFSSYLHPLSDKYLLGIGEDVDANLALREPAVFNETDRDTDVSELPSDSVEGDGGVKLVLFDVSDINQPTEVQTLVLGNTGSYSDALYDHRAVSLLQTEDGNYRLALPLSLTQFTTQYYQADRGLGLIDINVSDDAGLNLNGFLSTSDKDYYYNYVTRGIINGNKVHYVQSPHVWSTTWQDSKRVVGPK
ncbi:beta-propeller domain-containing protein [Catenovulum sp. SM1970]|uniref:beta-propeller domain-containing protein n=1 Tax=Marinifaba aquimaris TaxID=2741323 RepID=UPI001571A857|nr:beta-propeller domain-containing protein [Marinifaba aquimaris]NTS77018.1 beta-propeller domain-containing protein [Marinifaba aquimaris]